MTKRKSPDASPLEWIVGSIGALIFLGIVAVIASSALSAEDGPADVVVTAVGVTTSDGRHVVEFEARNEGATTAAAVEITGALVRDGAVVEERSATLDYVPRHSRQRGGLFFSNDPRLGDLSLEAEGYSDP